MGQPGTLYFPRTVFTRPVLGQHFHLSGGSSRKISYYNIPLFMTEMLCPLPLIWSCVKHIALFFTHCFGFDLGSIYLHKSSNSHITSSLLFDTTLYFLICSCFQCQLFYNILIWWLFTDLSRYCLPGSNMSQQNCLPNAATFNLLSKGKEDVCLKCRSTGLWWKLCTTSVETWSKFRAVAHLWHWKSGTHSKIGYHLFRTQIPAFGCDKKISIIIRKVIPG